MGEAVRDVLVVGGGPAGLAAALRLKARDVPRVTIIEREDALGGMPRRALHSFFGFREFGRFLSGPSYAAKLAAWAQAAGVEIWSGQEVTALRPGGGVVVQTPEGTREVRARRVLLAMGARARRVEDWRADAAGRLGVLDSSALPPDAAALPCCRPVLVGGDRVSLSALATCRRQGMRPVAMVEANPRPAVSWPLTLYARLAGARLRLGTEIERIEGEGGVERVVLSNGQVLACDGVLVTGGLQPEVGLVRDSHLRLDHGAGGPAVDQYGRCSDTAFFAMGNVLGAAEGAGWNFQAGQTTGDFIADDLIGGLPSLEGALAIEAGAAVRFVLPQSLAHVAPLRGRLYVRVAAPVKGLLRVRAGAIVLYRRRVEAVPERRVLIDLDGLKTPPDDALLTVEVVA